MKVVYIGSYDLLAKGVLERLKKEEHDVYFISKEDSLKETRAFSRVRCFKILQNEDLGPILSTISADVVIYAGIDFLMDEWTTAQEENITLTVALLEEIARQKIEKLVFLSSDEVYGVKNEVKTEESPLKPYTRKGMWLSQEENIVKMYQEMCQVNTVILRLNKIFNNEVIIGTDTFLGQVSKNVRMENIPAIEECSIQPVHVADVADAIKRVIETVDNGIYNVNSSADIKLSKVYSYTGKRIGRKGTPNVKNAKKEEFLIDNSKIKSTLEWTDFWQLEKLFEEEKITFKKKKDDAVKQEEKQKNHGLRRTIENIVVFLIFTLLYQFSNDHNLFNQIHWHLIYVVLISLCYGVKQGALSVLLASGYYLFAKDESLLEMVNFYSYIDNVLVIVQYIFFGIVVGYTADMLRENLRSKDEKLKDLEADYGKLKDIHEKNVMVKNEYEKRLLEAKTGLPHLYNIINRINVLDAQRVFVEVINVVQELLNTDTVCVYKVTQGDTYLRLMAALNDKSAMGGKSWNIEEYTRLRQALESGSIYEGNIWEKEPAIVMPIVSSAGCQAAIVVKEMPMESMSLYSINMLRTLFALLAETMDKALHYEELIREEKYIKDTDILIYDEFIKAVNLAKEKKDRNLADYSLIQLEPGLDINENFHKISDLIREMDELGCDKKGNLYILLGNASKADTKVVLERINNSGIKAVEVEELK